MNSVSSIFNQKRFTKLLNKRHVAERSQHNKQRTENIIFRVTQFSIRTQEICVVSNIKKLFNLSSIFHIISSLIKAFFSITETNYILLVETNAFFAADSTLVHQYGSSTD